MNDSFLGFGPGHWGLGLVMWLLIVVGFIVMYFAIRKKSRDETDVNIQQKSALQILQVRYAKGEIDDVEYAVKKRHLGSNP